MSKKSFTSATRSSLRIYKEPYLLPPTATVRKPLPSPFEQGDEVRILREDHKYHGKVAVVTYASGELVFLRYLAFNFHVRKEDVCLVAKHSRTSA